MNKPLLLALTLLLAGCTSDAPDPTPAATNAIAPPAQADEDSGGVDGLVTDDSLAPIQGAQVQIVDVGETTTDAGGRFTFSRVPPGEHSLHVAGLGYESKATRFTVAAGEVAPLKIVLVPLAIKEPYVETAIKAGEIMCSGYVRVYNGLPGAIGACTVVDQFRTNWAWKNLEGASGMWIETTWRSTQLAGNGLELYVPFGVATTYWTYLARNVVGPSPIQHPVPGETMEEFLAGHKESFDSCPTKTCVMQIWHYVYGNTLGPSAPADAGVLLQQKYEDYVTLFYNTEFPATFSALADG